MATPRGLIAFNELDLCGPYKRQWQIILASVGLLGIMGPALSLLFGLNILLIPMMVVLAVLIFIFFGFDSWSLINTPLAVNMNHPFVDGEPIGKAVVQIRDSSGNWQELGQYRVRIVKDELVGGYNLVEDNDDYRLIGHLSTSSNKARIMKQIIIVNQALSLRDVVNGDIDPIEDARAREKMDYGLLERNWLQDEELEIEGPLAKFLNKE